MCLMHEICLFIITSLLKQNNVYTGNQLTRISADFHGVPESIGPENTVLRTGPWGVKLKVNPEKGHNSTAVHSDGPLPSYKHGEHQC